MQFVNSIRTVNPIDYSVTFYILIITFTFCIIIGLFSLIYPGKWTDYSEEKLYDETEYKVKPLEEKK